MPGQEHLGPIVAGRVDAVAVVADLIFATRIRSTAEAIGCSLEVVQTAKALEEILERAEPAAVIVDLNSAGAEALRATEAARWRTPRPRIIAYYSHVDEHLASQALEAGADEAMPRSRFSSQLPNLLKRWTNSDDRS